MKKYLIVIFVLVTAFQCPAQEKFELKKIGFSVQPPKGWLSKKNDALLEKLNNPDLTDKELDELIKSDGTTLSFASYAKYPQEKYKGIVPSINIRTRQARYASDAEFLQLISKMASQAKSSVDNFRFIENPSLVSVSGKKAVKISVDFVLKINGKNQKITSHSYYILRDGYYILVNFLEEAGKENNGKLFFDMINSISITE